MKKVTLIVRAWQNSEVFAKKSKNCPERTLHVLAKVQRLMAKLKYTSDSHMVLEVTKMKHHIALCTY